MIVDWKFETTILLFCDRTNTQKRRKYYLPNIALISICLEKNREERILEQKL